MAKRTGRGTGFRPPEAWDGEVDEWWTTSLGEDGEVLPRGSGRDAEGAWDFTLGFTQVGERLYPSHIRLTPGYLQEGIPPGGITARLLHAIKLGALVDQFRREYEGDREAEALFFRRRTKRPYQLPKEGNRLGPKGLGEDFYRDVAAGYVQAFRTDARRPIEELTRSYPGYSTANVRDWVRVTRLKGYLTSPGRGRGGGEPTQKLIDALKAGGRPDSAPRRRSR